MCSKNGRVRQISGAAVGFSDVTSNDATLESDPRQQQLAELMINVSRRQGTVEEVFKFLTAQGWRHSEIEKRACHAACVADKLRPEAYPRAKKIAQMFRTAF
jgi:hypothetical protein